ncbi:membrane protein [Trabulsiella odontotermitis]|nr:membrane protein [Trabulsiella odontotermitis]
MKATCFSLNKFKLILCAVAGLSAAAASAEPYRPVAAVVPEQAQVVMYYPQGSVPAAVYVDRELQSALLPGEFTVFCVTPGAHAIESVFNDQPLYQGKQNPTQQLPAEGGETYFVQVNPGTTGNTAALEERPQAETMLSGLQKHTRIVNRASQVKSCNYINTSGVILIQEQVLFRFAKSDTEGILPESRDKLDNVVKFIKQASNVSEIQLIGFTDAIGNRDANLRLSEARASTVRTFLIEKGIKPEMINNAMGQGVAQSAEGCGTRASQQDAGCNVNSRRVDILVRGN